MTTPCLAVGVVANSKNMETTHKITVKDKTRIKSIRFKFPELMDTDALNVIKDEYYVLMDAKGELYEARERVRFLEKRYDKIKKEWDAKKDMFDIEFESYDKEVKTIKSYMTINGKTVYDCNKG